MQKGRIITPTQFAKELIQAVEGDPGTERKAMLFRLAEDPEWVFLDFVCVRSEARVCVLELTRERVRDQIADSAEGADAKG